MADVDRRLNLASDTTAPTPLPAQTHAQTDIAADVAAQTPLHSHGAEHPAVDPLLDRMVRIPTEADFADVLTPEGNSGDIFGSGVSDSTAVSNGSLAGTG